MPKRMILCLDGTWDSADSPSPSLPTNVARLSRMLARQGRTKDGLPIDQLIYYQPGIGTGPLVHLNRIYQGITGASLSSHLLTAYHFLSTNYSPGDEIFLFGYSRGAYTARALGWFVTKVGVLRPEDLESFEGLFGGLKGVRGEKVDVWEELRGLMDGGFAGVEGRGEDVLGDGDGTPGELKSRMGKKFKPTPVEISVEGVWETVGSLGLPESWFTKCTGFNKMYRFYDTTLDDKVHHAFQALSLDEHRGAFVPAIWYLDPKFKDKVDLKQCWFPGFHGEVGGGVAGPVGRNHLAIEDITLAWMCDQIDGLLTFDEEASKNILGEIKENVKWGLSREIDPSGGIWNLSVAGGNSILRTPGSYHKRQSPKTSNPEGYTTNETMHPSIKLLIDSPEAKYFPPALDSRTSLKMAKTPKWKFIDKSESGQGASWTRPCQKPGKTVIEIKEHVIRERPGRNNFESRLLPVAVQDMLHRRNLEEFEKMYQSQSSLDYEESI